MKINNMGITNMNENITNTINNMRQSGNMN